MTRGRGQPHGLKSPCPTTRGEAGTWLREGATSPRRPCPHRRACHRQAVRVQTLLGARVPRAWTAATLPTCHQTRVKRVAKSDFAAQDVLQCHVAFPPQALPRRDSRFAHRAWRPRRRRRWRSVAKSTSTWVGWSVVTSTQMAAVGGNVHVDVGGGPCDGPPGPTRGAHRCIGNWVPRSLCQTMSSWPVCFRAVPPQQPPGPASGSHTDRGAGRKRFQLLLPDVAASVHPGRFLACAPGETPPAKHSASV